MARRFNDLEARLLSFLAGGGNVANIQEEDLKNYAEWKFNVGGRKRLLPEASTRNREGLKYAIIDPFGSDTANLIVLASVSERARAWLAGQPAALKTAVGWKAVPAADAANQPKFINGFKPARAVIRQKSTSSTERTSRITGKIYKSRAGSSQQGYSIPFGSVSDSDEIGQSRAIQAAVLDANFSVNFLPEKFVNAPQVVALT
jgi:hypothetical protein